MNHKILAGLVILLIIIPAFCEAGSFQISGSADARYINTDGNENDVELEGLFLNFRKVFSDKKGDRLIAVGQLDMDQNFEKIRPYQTYLQYKGPLGKWNIRLGHYILPFGLLSDYDTERLILKTIEDLSLGVKLDTGVLKYSHWQRKGDRNFIGAGFSYQFFKGLFLRIADEYQFGKENENVATTQTYFEFLKQF